MAFKSAIFSSLPPNEGAFRPLEANLTGGTVVSAVDNVAMSPWNLALKTLIGTIYLALSQAAPERCGPQIDLIVAFERSECALQALFGGRAVVGIVLVTHPGETAPTLYQKVTNLPLQAGATGHCCPAAAAAGADRPEAAAPDRVLRVVRLGYVILAGAQRYYGVVIDSGAMTVDEAATTARRATMGLGTTCPRTASRRMAVGMKRRRRSCGSSASWTTATTRG